MMDMVHMIDITAKNGVMSCSLLFVRRVITGMGSKRREGRHELEY